MVMWKSTSVAAVRNGGWAVWPRHRRTVSRTREEKRKTMPIFWRVGPARYRIGIQARPLGGLAFWASARWWFSLFFSVSDSFLFSKFFLLI
jgi:hypothetical protein